jgi:molybdate transport system substrate-binding protein
VARFLPLLAALIALLSILNPVLAQQAPAKPLLVFAPASLHNALTRIAQNWQAETGRKVIFSFAATPALARQIEQGAPADLVASADQEWMDWLEARHLIRPETRKPLLGNSIVLIARADDPVELKIEPGFALLQAIGASRLAMGAAPSVPAGRYAKEALSALGVWESLAPKIVGTENVRVALHLVARGEARLGIVYTSDALAEPRVRIVDRFPPQIHAPIRYPFALIRRSTHPDAAAFLSYLLGQKSAEIFTLEGFEVLK